MTAEAYELPPVPMSVAAWRSEDIRIMIDFARLAVKQERERYVLSYMALAEAMGYNERGRENELESPEEYAARLFAAAIRAG
jgi:hypothetical protein